MADIGKLSVTVSASGKSIPADMRKAADDLGAGAAAMGKAADTAGRSIGEKFAKGVRDKWDAFGNFTTAKKSPVAGLFGDAFGGLRGILEEGFSNPIKAANDIVLGSVAGMASKIPVVGSILAAPLLAVNGLVSTGIGIYEANIDRIKSLGKGAAKAGLDVGDFQLLSKITGDVDGASHAWGKFNMRLSEAEIAGDGVRTAFDRFGMDGKKVAADFEGDFKGALGRTFDRIAALPMSMQPMAAHELFGRQGVEMLPSIRKGAAGVAEQQGMLDKFGGGVNDSLFQSVRQVEKAKKEIAGLWEGFGNQVTMAVAPVLAMVSEGIGKLPMGFAGLGETILETAGKAALFVADVIDGWTNGDTADRLEPYWLEFKAAGADAIDFILDRFAEGMTSKIVPKWLQLSAAFGLVIADKFAFGKLSESTAKTPDGKSQADRWREEAEEMRAFNEAFGTSETRDLVQEKIDEALKRLRGAGKAGEFDPFGKLYDRIGKLNDANKGPLAEFNEGLGDTLDLLKKVGEAADLTALRGINDVIGPLTSPEGGISPIHEGAAEMDAYAKYMKLKGIGGDTNKLAGALEAGSTGAYSAIAQFEANRPEDVQQEMKRLMEFAQRQRDEQIRVGREAADAFRRIKVAKF